MLSLYHRLPRSLRIALTPLKAAAKLLSALRVNVWEVRGSELQSGEMLSLVFVGRTVETRNYWTDHAFGSSREESLLGQKWLWQVPKWLSEKGDPYGLVLVEMPRILRAWVCKGGVFVPNWIGGLVDITKDQISITSKKKSLRSDLQSIKKSGLTYRVTTDSDAFDDFYHHMYVPHISQAHGDSAVVMAYGPKRQEFQACELLLVEREGEAISGILLTYPKDGPRLWSLGVRNGDHTLVREGAIGALFYFASSYLSEKGFPQVHFGFSRPFLRDGVLRFKKKWNIRFCDTDALGVKVQIHSITAGVKRFLANNPFVYLDDNGFTGAVFWDQVEPPSKEWLTDVQKNFLFNGMAGVAVFGLANGAVSTAKNIPNDLHGTVREGNVSVLRSA